MTLSRTPLSLYVHWPYCSFLCKFCAFSKTRATKQTDNTRTALALLRELESTLAAHKDKQLRSIYFGGGTPSLAHPDHIGRIIERAGELVPLAEDAEITLESNPTMAEVDKMRGFRAAGVNRYSIGVQTLDDRVLRQMGRLHTGAEGLAAVDRAREIFGGKVTFDMMFGFAGQTVDAWGEQLNTALDHGDQHVSIYQLTVEPGTPLYRDHLAGRIRVPGDETQAEMYERTVDICRKRGFRQYEVSSYAKSREAEGRHNMAYWRGQQYVGIGPSAHSRFVDCVSGRRVRQVRVPDAARWMEACEALGHGTAKVSEVGGEEARQEMVVFGLRMLDGIDDAGFREVAGCALDEYLCMEQVMQYVDRGYLTWSTCGKDRLSHCLAPTERGLQVIDTILLDILPAV
ncbi:radical S-adenosyl methionine domain-containing protein 1 [Coemansia sp. RSA 2703]|nr:radical S-adenosyl methionine domain-containing protein 1 [Coemansia sp. RSA 2703]